uniref:Uncharacterized protein n=1 Tax=Mycena chlorophos TaxID=658473 RepID=A0ABQ0M5Y9_MYCCL|nr:predicted protein [Mycena chlorophos]
MIARSFKSHFIVYSLRPLSRYPGYRKNNTFVAGDYATDRVVLPCPPSSIVRVRSGPELLKRRFLAYLHKTAMLLRQGDTLLVPILAPCRANIALIQLDESVVELSCEELVSALGLSLGADIVLWMPGWPQSMAWADPTLPWRVIFPSSELLDKFPTEPFNIAPFILPKRPEVAGPPDWKHSGPKANELLHAASLVEKLRTAINNLAHPEKLRHPVDLLLYSVYQLRILATSEFHSALAGPIYHPRREQPSLVELNRLGDVFAHRLDCFMTEYVFSRYILGTPLERLHCSAPDPRGIYWQWLEEACIAPVDSLNMFQDQDTLADLPDIVGTEGVFNGEPVHWTESLKWMADNWVAAGKPSVTLRQIALARLWRASAFAGSDVLALCEIVDARHEVEPAQAAISSNIFLSFSGILPGKAQAPGFLRLFIRLLIHEDLGGQ